MIEHDSKTNQSYWVKRVPLRRAKRELEALKAVKGTMFPQLMDYHVESDAFVLKLLYIEGCPLAEAKLRGDQAPGLFVRMIHVLKYLHEQNLLHRDLSANNILVDACENVYFIDFGLAAKKEAVCLETETHGTLAYAAPEAVFNPKAYDESCDIFALSKVFLEKFQGISHQFDPRFYKILMRCQSLEPKYRFGTCSEILHEIDRSL